MRFFLMCKFIFFLFKFVLLLILNSFEYGFFFIGGWGFGIDWFVMFFIDCFNIKEVFFFFVMWFVVVNFVEVVVFSVIVIEVVKEVKV